jgi:glycerol-3-phosphate dehydrogenase
MAYRQVRGDLISTVPPTAFEIVWVQQDRLAVLVRTDADLARAVRASSSVIVVTPAAEIERVLKAWSIEHEDRLHNLAVLKRGRRQAHEDVS